MMILSGKLFVLGTPIGNLSDFSPRGIETLNQVDFIAAEDTRVTLKLLNRFDIKKPMVSYYEHNQFTRGKEIIERIKNGENCAIVTDAGMPAISDPGEQLVKEALDNGISVVSVPGPSAFVTALSVSGCKSQRFCFEGFLSVDKKKRKEHLNELKGEKRTICLYEAPHKLKVTLSDLYDALGNRNIVLVRELTKVHEEILRMSLEEAVDFYQTNQPKGEFVIIIDGEEKVNSKEYNLDEAIEMAMKFVDEGMSTSSAAKRASLDTGIKKGDIYNALLKNK